MATSSRRQPVAEGGGLFSTPKASFSKDTQELLKVMMQESKLTNFQQRKLRETMMNGQSLPAQCLPTSSKPGSGRPSRASQTSRKKQTRPQRGLRSKEIIQQMSDTSPSYQPPPQRYDGIKEKQRLQNLMTYGSELEPIPANVLSQPAEKTEEVDRFDEVVEEIEERRLFLSEMEALGQGKEHRNKIMTEISQRVHELEKIDKERSEQLMNSHTQSTQS